MAALWKSQTSGGKYNTVSRKKHFLCLQTTVSAIQQRHNRRLFQAAGSGKQKTRWTDFVLGRGSTLADVSADR